MTSRRRARLIEFKTMCLRTGGANHEMRSTPGVPNEAIARLCMRLIAEEALETMRAVFSDHYMINDAENFLLATCEHSPIDVNMIEFVDGLEDTDYVVENARLAFGVDGEPIARIVHAANMAKADGPLDPNTGKKLKPPGWEPPTKAIEAELRRQGWTG